MQELPQRREDTTRFLTWIREYTGWWYLICTPGAEEMNLDMMNMLIQRLYKEQFYEMIFVLLMVHRNEKIMENFFKFMCLDFLLAAWKGESKTQAQIVQDIANYFI